MGDAGQEDLVEVAQHGAERLGRFGSAGGQPVPDLPRPDLGEHRELADSLEVAGGPLERGRAVRAEIGQAVLLAKDSEYAFGRN